MPKQDQSQRIPALLDDYQKIIHNSNMQDPLSKEQLKLQIIDQILRQLKMIIDDSPSTHEPDIIQTQPIPQETCKKILYYLLVVLGTLQVAARNYLFGTALIGLLPGLSPITTIILSCLYVVLNNIFFYAFEVSLLRNALGISNTHTHLEHLINTHLEQIKKIKTINLLLLNIATINHKLYKDYEPIITVLNHDIQTKYNDLQTHNQSLLKKILTIAMVGLGTLSTAAISYFILNTMLTLWATTLIGTPLGILIILLGVAADIGFYYVMGASGVMRLINSDYENYQTLKQELELFDKDYNCSFFAQKRRRAYDNKPELNDAATQTEFGLLTLTAT